MNRYLLHFMVAAFTLLSAVAAINWLADPYMIFGAPIIRGVNAVKPELGTHGRVFKMVNYSHQPMDALILGTSRADFGLNPKHEGFKNVRTFNLAMGAQPIGETATIFKFVSDRNPLKTAIIGLDFFASNALFSYTPDFSLDNFSDDRKLRLLFSVGTLNSSLKTLFRSGEESGLKQDVSRQLAVSFDKSIFVEREKDYVAGTYEPPPRCEYLFEDNRMTNGNVRKRAPLDELRALIALAYQRHVKLNLFISPSHARQWEVLASVGLWEKWEDWKRRLVNINEEEARRAGQQPYSLFDFSGYNSITTEAFPDTINKKTMMYGYIDSSHYKPVVGDLILDRVFELQVAGRTAPRDFGVVMNSGNLNEHLASIRTARENYRQTHPQDAAEIEAMVRKVTKTKKCQSAK